MFNISYLEYLKKHSKVHKNLLIPVELDYWLRSVAKNKEISYSALVRGILEDYRETTTGIKA